MPMLPLPDAVASLLIVTTWLLFCGGVLLVIASWIGRADTRLGWVGAWMTITGGAMSLTGQPMLRALILAAGIVVIALLWLPRRRKRTLWTPRRKAFKPWDQEAELLRLCLGDTAIVERLIEFERERNPKLSRAGAALAAATRLRHEK
jgi:hypothetical protein